MAKEEHRLRDHVMETSAVLLRRPPCCHRPNSRDDIGGAIGIIEDTLASIRALSERSARVDRANAARFRRWSSQRLALVDLVRDRRSDSPRAQKAAPRARNPPALAEAVPGRESVCYVDSSAKTDSAPADRFQPGGCEQHVDFAPIERDKLRFFLKRRQSAEPGFHCASERIGPSLPEKIR